MSWPIIGVSGGLGNQLFQISRGLAISETVRLDFDSAFNRKFGKKSDLLDFNLPQELNVMRYRSSWITRVAFNKCLSNSQKEGILNEILSTMYRLIFKFTFTFFNQNIISVVRTKGLGFYEVKPPKKPYLIGYFQSWRWSSSQRVIDVMFRLEPKKISKELEIAVNEIISSKGIALHVRLGDYLKEDKFGILPVTYYQNALVQIDKNWHARNLWIFSDDIAEAKRKFSNAFQSAKSVTWIQAIDESTAQTWHLLRHASDFVIANSTFSWWAAQLRFIDSGIVCAPTPWFCGMNSPEELIPEDWIKVDSFTDGKFLANSEQVEK